MNDSEFSWRNAGVYDWNASGPRFNTLLKMLLFLFYFAFFRFIFVSKFFL